MQSVTMDSVVLLVLWLAGRGAGFVVGSGRVSRNLVECGLGPPVVVALTREAGKNEGLRRALSDDRRLSTVEVPCVMQTRDGTMEAALDDALMAAPWDWVVVTSPEAAATLSASARRTGLGVALRVASVGDATARALEGGLSSAFKPSKATAATLGAELPGNSGDRVLFPASALAAETLETALVDRGFVVERVNAYTTVPAPWSDEDLALASSAQVVAFGSPSAVDVWVERLGATPRAACIGRTTAIACDAAGFEPRAKFPAKPGVPGWAAAVVDVADDILRPSSGS